MEEQLKILAKRFGIKKVVFVGDRGMIKRAKIEDIQALEYNFITAITKEHTKTLLAEKVITMELFDKNLCEVEENGLRYIMRKNYQRAKEIEENRMEKIEFIKEKCDLKNKYLKDHSRAKVEKGEQSISLWISKLKLSSAITVKSNNRNIEIEINDGEIQKMKQLDGCYVIKTDVSKNELSTEEAHQRYKDLSFVETVFRTMKTDLLDIRPINHRLEERTKAHVFLVMLAYKMIIELRIKWKGLDVTVSEGLKMLESIQAIILKIPTNQKDKIVEIIEIPEPRDELKILLDRLDIKLPSNLLVKPDLAATTTKSLG